MDRPPGCQSDGPALKAHRGKRLNFTPCGLSYGHLAQRARAAALAISDRRVGVSLAARARPPLGPPSLPSMTAAGFFPSSGFFWPVACCTMSKANVLVSRLVACFAMGSWSHRGREASRLRNFKLNHYRRERALHVPLRVTSSTFRRRVLPPRVGFAILSSGMLPAYRRPTRQKPGIFNT